MKQKNVRGKEIDSPPLYVSSMCG